VFLNKYNNIILAKARCVESVLQTPCLRPDNIGAATVKGLELETSIYPVDGLSIEGSLALLDFKYTSPTINGFLVSGEDAQGNPVQGAVPASGITPYTPEVSYSISTQYDHETDVGTFSIRVDGSYQGKLFTNAENTTWATIPGRFLANGRLTWTTTDDEWKVSLEVQNIFDKYYMQTVSDITTSLGLVTGVPGLPRTVAVSVERKF
jgi:iron complex outermembrane receptor protein